MKIVFVLLLAVAWLSTASASDCKNKMSEMNCKYNHDNIKRMYHMDMCVARPAKAIADMCKKFCKACGPWNPCNPVMAGKDNVMCIYKKGVFGPKCGSKSAVKTEPLSKKQQKFIVDRINKLREKVASGKQKGLPEGTIPPLKWDDGLAAAAQRWADQCPSPPHPHSKNNAIKQFPNGAGQNLATSVFPATDVPKELSDTEIKLFIDGWYGEVKDFVKHKCSISHFDSHCAGGAMVGHFTQLIWAKTTSVGCGYIKYKGEMQGMHGYVTSLVCDFGPAGNSAMRMPSGKIIGSPIYKKK